MLASITVSTRTIMAVPPHIRVPFLKSRGLLSLFVAAVIVVGLVDRFTGNAPAESHAQVWVGRAADSGAVDTVIHAYDGKTLASLDSNGHVALWDVGTGRLHEFQPLAAGSVRTLAFSPDGQTLAGGVLDSTIVLWDMDTLQARTELRRTFRRSARWPIHLMAA